MADEITHDRDDAVAPDTRAPSDFLGITAPAHRQPNQPHGAFGSTSRNRVSADAAPQIPLLPGKTMKRPALNVPALRAPPCRDRAPQRHGRETVQEGDKRSPAAGRQQQHPQPPAPPIRAAAMPQSEDPECPRRLHCAAAPSLTAAARIWSWIAHAPTLLREVHARGARTGFRCASTR